MIDYKKLGFKCGIELHSQLETHKLFCKCPSITNKKEEPDLVIKRKLRAVAGLAGEKDVAAKFEENKDLTFHYEFYHDCNCLTCLDEEPPNKLNPKALQTALEICLLLNAKIEKKIKVMRKIVVDGSNVSGFQRTMLIAKDGKLKTSKGVVNIPTIFLEEEAAKKIKKRGKDVTYRLDRLGVPLVEIATGPDIKDPEHAKETAELLGQILKSTGKTKSGLGTKRQDVNISIKGSPRIEIKGFQDLKSIPKIIDYEISRLIKDKPKKGEVRKAEKIMRTTFLRPLPGESRFYPETDHKIIEISKTFLAKVKKPELIEEKALKLEKLGLNQELAKEIVERKIPIKELSKKYPRVGSNMIARIMIEMPKELRSRLKVDYKFTLTEMKTVLDNVNKENLQKEAILDMLQKIAKKQKINLEDYKFVPVGEIKEEIIKILEKQPGISEGGIMGLVMKKFSGRVNPKQIIELIKELT